MAARQDEFERIAMPHTGSLLRVARRLCSRPEAAEDLVQETMLSAWRGFHQFRAGTNERAWLFRILINAFHGQRRKRNTDLSSVPFESIEARSNPQSLAALEMAEALNGLVIEQRTVLLLGVVEGFTCQEMAEILGVPIGTVMSRISRARQALRARLKPTYTAKAAC